ncbi:MAG: endonuclease/exonuclease/phosphatase family protein [Phototrophicaceae bacterium]
MQTSRQTILARIRQFFLALFAIYFALSLIGAVIYFFLEPNVSRIELFKLLFGLSLWLSIPLTIILIILRAWRLMIGSLILVGLFILLYTPLLIPRNPSIDADMPQLKIMTFNTLGTSEGLTDAILSADADVVAIQELSQDGSTMLRQLDNVYPFQALHPQADPNTGQGILSRYPIEVDDYWEYPDVPYTLGHQRVEVDMNGERIVIYNTHPWPPLAWNTGYNDESHRVVINDIADRVFGEELPVILAGDFNMTSVFEEYDLLSTQLIDSFLVAGDGIGYTFPNNKFQPLPRILRLDYIWHTDHFQSVDSTVWQDHGQSDHSPVVSTLILIKATDN